ncbi:MAG: ABC transporter ATP-binding protein [Firmicutes bacterium]|nr:ABC transporter ATP-binding protein [Bacillota bacterium]
MALLEIKDLCYSYADGDNRKVIYDNASASFESGRFYAITGESGSGKTTLLYIIGGLEKEYGGKVFFKGKTIEEIGLTKYRRDHISMIYQNFNLIPYLSPVENIEVALDITDNDNDKSKDHIIQLLSKLGIDEKAATRRASVLSGGEQQRAAIGRAVATGSEIIIADEPTGNLDAHTAEQVIELFRDLAHNEGKCVIMVTHNERFAEIADEWLCIDQENKKIVPARAKQDF